MSLLLENLSYLEKNYSELYNDVMDKLSAIKEDDGTIALCTSKLGQLNLEINVEGNKYFVHSNYNVDVEAKRWATAVDKDAGTVVVMGLGLGYHIFALLEELRDNVTLFIIEPDIRIFKYFLENQDIKKFFNKKNVTLILNNTGEGVSRDIFEAFKKKMFEKVDFKLYSGYIKLYEGVFNTLQRHFADIIKVLSVNIATNEYFKEMWIANFLMNIIHMDGAYNGKQMENIFKDKPLLLISAGPSLEKNIEQLRELKDKCIFLAGGSALRILKKNGISPHFAVVIDGSPLIKDIYEGIDFEGVTLLYINRCYYELIEVCKTKKVVFIDTLDKLTKKFGEQLGITFQELIPDSTVAGISVGIATYFGCNPIVMVGQDFALTNLKFHAEGAAHNENYEEKIKNGDKELIESVDIYGQVTYTNKSLLVSKISMENRVFESIDQGFKFINATEGGIGVEHSINMDLSEVTQKYLNSSYDFEGILQDHLKDKSLIRISKERLGEYFEELASKADELRSISKSLYDLCNNMKRLLDKKNTPINKYGVMAIEINKWQQQVEENGFYKDYVVSMIEQTIAIHKMVMDHSINMSNEDIGKNKARVDFIIRQCLENIGFCNYVVDFVNNVYKQSYS